MDKVIAVRKNKYPVDVMFTFIGALCIVAGVVCFVLVGTEQAGAAGFWAISAILTALGILIVGWIIYDYLSFRRMPEVLVEVKEEQFYILGERVEKEDIKQFYYSESRGRKGLSLGWGTLEFVLADGKKLKCRFAENVKEAYIELMKLVRGLSFDDEPSAEEILHG